MKIVALVPAKGGSVGIPGKNLTLINGRPLLWYTLVKLLHSSIHEIYVSTQWQEVMDYAESLGVRYIVEPDRIPEKSKRLEECMFWFVDQVELDVLVVIQPTSPLLRLKDLERGLDMFLSGGYDSAMSVVDTTDVLLWRSDINVPVNYNPLNRETRQTRVSDYVIESGGVYITTKEQLLASKCRIGGNILFIRVPLWTYHQLDEPEDIEVIEKLLREE